MQDLSLAMYSDDPIYNMKAITQRTGIPAATLRAWERRYHALAPHRSEGNYRLYSERDLAVLRWLQEQLNAGLSISRAVALLDRLREQAATDSLAKNAAPSQAVVNGESAGVSGHSFIRGEGAETWERLTRSLVESILAIDELRAGAVLSEAFALFGVEDVCVHVIAPVMSQVGEDWSRGRCTAVQEHFASAYLIGRLMALLSAQRNGPGPLILVGCAPDERHELGALMLALMLRRAAHNVRYLGASVPVNDLLHTIKLMKPRIIALSASVASSLAGLVELQREVAAAGVKTHLILGGRAFTLAARSSATLQGDYVGVDICAGIAAIERVLVTPEIH